MGREPGIGPAQLTCPDADTDDGDQTVQVVFASLSSRTDPKIIANANTCTVLLLDPRPVAVNPAVLSPLPPLAVPLLFNPQSTAPTHNRSRVLTLTLPFQSWHEAL